VYNGQQLIGRVTADVSAMQSMLRPIVRETGPIKVRAIAKNEVAPRAGQDFQIEVDGDGTFIAEPDKSVIMNEGDEVRLLDGEWPQSAQMMVVGIVESVRNNDKKPLRNLAIIRPTLQVSQLSHVVLKIETDGSNGTDGEDK
jgi:hypothetical protein